jgi:hypothetical protein
MDAGKLLVLSTHPCLRPFYSFFQLGFMSIGQIASEVTQHIGMITAFQMQTINILNNLFAG